ncbi:MAG: hypothetical protein J07HR59_00970 [Halorubrum sp. J07HR59]|nr:MAG: hypothetical protein J07HR59_00970 [Halorubrum sp. J07HR59]
MTEPPARHSVRPIPGALGLIRLCQAERIYRESSQIRQVYRRSRRLPRGLTPRQFTVSRLATMQCQVRQNTVGRTRFKRIYANNGRLSR